MSTITELLKDKWRSVDELPKLSYSFDCLIQFEEHGFVEDCKYLSTGTYWHKDDYLKIDDIQMREYTPSKFYPLYEKI